jgi:hypothetical protein
MNIVILDLIENNPVNDSNTTNNSTNPIPNPIYLVTFNTYNLMENTTNNNNTPLLTKI